MAPVAAWARRWVTAVTDAAGHTSATSYDLDGLAVETTDKQGATTRVSYDPRGLVAEVRMPHDDPGGSISYRTTLYEYDQAGNRTKVITPRGVETTGVADDFVHESVYDGLNRVIEQIHPWTRPIRSSTPRTRPSTATTPSAS